MNDRNQSIKDAILTAALPNVAFDGWTMAALENAAQSCGYQKDMVPSVFPGGVKDAVRHFAAMADWAMLQRLGDVAPEMKIRDRITLAVRTRFEWLAQHKEAERLAIAYWARPLRKFEGAKIVWATADAIWNWAGDTSADYNRYTKRGILAGVLASTTLYWLSDSSKNYGETWAFLDRRIENALSLGRIAGKLKKA